MKVHFQKETAAGIFDEAMPLLQLHWEEIAHYKDIPLKPNRDLYEGLCTAGVLRTFTARDEGNALVGYAVFFVRANPHYVSSIQAVQDVLFIHPEKRGFGAKFILWCDRELKKENVQVVYHHVKEAHDFGPMLKRMGYKLVDLIYARRLD